MERGLRERKKLATRHRIADAAAALFAAQGFDGVSMLDIAHAAEISEQTLYNYFRTKPELVLDRAEEIRERYGELVRNRAAGITPARVMQSVVHEDIDRFAAADPSLARGEFPAQCLQSPVLRRFALEARETEAHTIADAILRAGSALTPLIAYVHAASLVAVVQAITDRIGAAVLAGADGDDSPAAMRADADLAFDQLHDVYLRSAA